jgi:hypothetical protein
VPVYQKGMPVQFVAGQDPARAALVQLATGDDSRVVPVNVVAGDPQRATQLQIQSSGDPSRVQRIQISGPPATDLAAWYIYNSGITVSGSGVSQWSDQSGSARHLLQGTDAKRPALQSDGSILFDGVDDFLQASFTLSQPETVYLLFRQVTWTQNEYIFDGGSNDSMILRQGISGGGVSPQLAMFAGTSLQYNGDLAVNTYGVAACVFNTTSSVLQINNGTPLTGAVGASNAGGVTLGSRFTPGAYSNIQVKEAIIYSSAHDSTTRGQVINYLARVGGLSI